MLWRMALTSAVTQYEERFGALDVQKVMDFQNADAAISAS
jgi:hypothetical protein